MNKFFKNINRNSNKAGFTIVETIVAIFIFSIAIVVMMTVFSRGIQGVNYSKTKIMATYLAQEGIEHTRNLRDNYVYFNNDWNGFIAKLIANDSGEGCFNEKGCYFDDGNLDFTSNTTQQMISNLQIIPCTSGGCAELRYDATNGRYGYSSGVYSGFRRRITVEKPNGSSADGVKIVSTVFFEKGSNTGSVSFSENLFNLTQ